MQLLQKTDLLQGRGSPEGDQLVYGDRAGGQDHRVSVQDARVNGLHDSYRGPRALRHTP